MNQKTFLFIGGIHRSGTSLLHEILRSHPRVSGFHRTKVPQDEGQHLQSVFQPAKAFGGPGRFGFDERSFMDEHHSLTTAENAKILFNQWSRHWDLQRDYLVEKSPPNLVRTRFLQAMFPRSAFIIVLRQPIAVAYATEKMSRTSIASLIEHTLLCYERFLSDLPRLNRCFVLRYEEFVRNPQAVFDEICRFIDIEPVRIQQKVHANVNDSYFKKWEKDKARLLTSLPATHEERANRIGYSLHRTKDLLSVSFLGTHDGPVQLSSA
jgi:hypothetical protein